MTYQARFLPLLALTVLAGCATTPPQPVPTAPEPDVTTATPDARPQPADAAPVLEVAPPQPVPAEPAPQPDPRTTVTAAEAAETRSVVFHLDAQTFDYAQDGETIHSGPISSGAEQSPTPTGKFSVLSKQLDKESSRYENELGMPAWMPYSIQFNGNYFMHEGWLPGHPASHGCVRLSRPDAEFLFARLQIGDAVSVMR